MNEVKKKPDHWKEQLRTFLQKNIFINKGLKIRAGHFLVLHLQQKCLLIVINFQMK
jgi:hypothetical protein